MLQFLAYSSFPIAISAMATTLFYSLVIHESIDLVHTIINGLGTFIVYNFVQIVPIFINKKSSPKSWFFRKYYKIILFLMFCSLIVTTYLSQYLNRYDFYNLTHLFILCLFYEAPKKYSLRNIPYLKTILISYIWTMACVFPNYTNTVPAPSPTFLIEFFLYIFSLCLAFDVRDREEDSMRGIKTIVNTLDFKVAKLISIAIFLLSSLFTIFLFSFSIQILIYILIHLVILSRLRLDSKYYYFLYFIDGLLITKLILLWEL